MLLEGVYGECREISQGDQALQTSVRQGMDMAAASLGKARLSDYLLGYLDAGLQPKTHAGSDVGESETRRAEGKYHQFSRFAQIERTDVSGLTASNRIFAVAGL